MAATLNPSGALPPPRMPAVDARFFSIMMSCGLFSDCGVAAIFASSWFIFKQLCEFFSSGASNRKPGAARVFSTFKSILKKSAAFPIFLLSPVLPTRPYARCAGKSGARGLDSFVVKERAVAPKRNTSLKLDTGALQTETTARLAEFVYKFVCFDGRSAKIMLHGDLGVY